MRLILPIIIIVLFLRPASPITAQLQTGKAAGGPSFFVDAANFASKDSLKGRLEIFLKIAYSELVFVKINETSFRAQYEINYTLTDKKQNPVAREIHDQTILTSRYFETVSDTRFHFIRETFNVPPGEYELTVTLTDKETQRFGQRKLDTPVKIFRDKPLGISDVLFADKVQKDTAMDIINVVPNVFRSFDADYEAYWVYFEIYNSRLSEKNRELLDSGRNRKENLDLIYRILDKNQNVILRDSLVKTTYAYQTFSSILLDKTKLSYGRYILEITVKRGADKAVTRSPFDVRVANIRGSDIAGAAFDLDQAIKQMRHVARQANIPKILKGTKEEKEKFFYDFWKPKDPTPDTERNELMEEYYRRVSYANRYFTSGYREGWDTDRGMVYIMLDAPDAIERHPFDIDAKPYEIWYYYQPNLKLIFIDYYGFGDYELLMASRQEFESYILMHRR